MTELKEFRGTIAEVMLFCHSNLTPGQILALGIGGKKDKKVHIVYHDDEKKTEKGFLANEVLTMLDEEFGYASHWSQVGEMEMLGLDERVKGACRRVVEEVLREIGERCLAGVSPRVIQLIFPLETKIRTESQERGRSIHVVKTDSVYYTADGRVVYAWNVPSFDNAKMKGSSDGTIFATLPRWEDGSVYKVYTFEKKSIADMRFTATEDSGGVISVEFADMSRSTFTMCVDSSGKLKPTHTPTVVKVAVKSSKRVQEAQTAQTSAFVS